MKIVVFTTYDGFYHVTETTNPCSILTEYNTYHPKNGVDRLIGYKPKSTKRTVESVVEKFKAKGHKTKVYVSIAKRRRQLSGRSMDRMVAAAVEKDDN